MQVGNWIACAVRTHQHEKPPFVVLVPPATIQQARYATVASLPPGSVGSGRTWRTPQGRFVTVVSYSDKPFEHKDFNLVLCCGGVSMTVEDMAGIRKWREKCLEEVRPWAL